MVKEDQNHPTLEVNFHYKKVKSTKSIQQKPILTPKRTPIPFDQQNHIFLKQKFNFHSVDWFHLKISLEDVNFESLFNTKDPNEALEKFYKILYTNLENLVP